MHNQAETPTESTSEPRPDGSKSGAATLFRRDRLFPMEVLAEENQGTPLWDPTERPADPMGARVRRVLARMKPAQAELLEKRYFLQVTMSELSATLGVSERALRGRMMRAREQFVKLFAETALLDAEIPDDEL